MKKDYVKLVEFTPKPGRCLKAIVKFRDFDGNVRERTVYARHSLIYKDCDIVSVQEVSEEDYSAWISSDSLGITSFTGAW